MSGKVEKVLSPEQKKIIYALANGLGIVDRNAEMDNLHLMIYSLTGKEHVSDLSMDEAAAVIDRLKGNMRGNIRFTHRHSEDERDGMASVGEVKKIWALIYEVRKYDKPDAPKIPMQKRLRGFLRKYAGVDDVKFLTSEKASAVIEGLKGLVATEKRKVQAK